jgi:putative nucleotidyltransferase with HDIG domain
MTKPIMINKFKLVVVAAGFILISYLLGLELIIPLFLISVYVYFKFRNLGSSVASILNLSLLYVIILSSSYFILRNRWPESYIPFSIIPLLATLLFNELEISILLSLVCGVTVASLAGGHFYLLVLFLISAITSSLLVFGARRRIVVIRAGLFVGIIQALSLFLVRHSWGEFTGQYLAFLLNGVLSSVIVIGILPVFEYLFCTVTNVSLLELADFNQPLLQRMIMEAPGTYHHSLVVGNLSEAACRQIGANALLARIGAYYHDIGKLEKADYFSENQNISSSRHDELSPTMSKLVIMNHVKEGVELAKRHNLNPRLIDFIRQHHGNSLVYYFYRRALEEIEEDQEIKEEGFRYLGPKPDTKETAIVLLADSVEAAIRALKEPTPPKIKEVVHKVINNKFIDGQLDECDLTLKDLEQISAVFIRILSGMYHSRISYPETTKSENNHKRSPKESSPKSEEDKKTGS